MRPKRYYTPVQANQTIARIEPIVRQLSERAGTLSGLRGLKQGRQADKPAPDSPVDAGYFRELVALDDGLQELRRHGCVLKDLQSGIVDFPARLQGREVCLCWMLGEDSIAYWHETDSGFKGRQPIEAGHDFEAGGAEED
jgi:hypothetical protein